MGVSALVAAAGLPMLGQEGTAEHIHAHLDVFYDGQPVTVPAGIGIDYGAQRISPLHTHDTTGIVHVESPQVKPFYLGQLFAEWGVQIGGGCIAGQCPPARPITVYVDGTAPATAPQTIELRAHEEIAVVIGTAPSSLPASYGFPQGY